MREEDELGTIGGFIGLVVGLLGPGGYTVLALDLRNGELAG